MDKNLIHIDDLIKQRLLGEEDERPGAWLHMRDLLDKNMPTSKVPAAFNWRRAITYAGVILAIGAVGVGGYEASTAFRDNGDAANQTEASSPLNEAGNNAIAENTTDISAPVTGNNSNNENPNTPAGANTVVAGNITSNKTTDNKSPQKNIEKKLNNSVKISNTKAYSSHSKAEGISDAIAKVNDKANGLVTDKPSQPKTNNTSIQKPAKNDGTAQQRGNTGKDLEKNTPQQPAMHKKDSIPMIAIVEKIQFDNKTGKPYFTARQVASERVERPVSDNGTSVASLGGAEKMTASNETPAIIPGSSFIGPMPDEAHTAAATKNNALAAGNSGANNLEKRKDQKGWNFRAVFELLNEAKDRLANMQVQHSQGVMFGVNALFSTPSFMGFQLGLYENMRFNENWSMQIEGKYLQRFKGVTQQDNYTTYEKDADGRYTQNLVEHSFKYNSLSSFELPVMVRYNTADTKWNFFAGGSVNYNLAIKNEEISHISPVATGLKFAQEPVSETPKVTANDFAARLGLGYLVGVSYNLSSKAQIDARFTQAVWDNAQGAGQQKISNSLYRAPSAQISFGWRFGKDKKDK